MYNYKLTTNAEKDLIRIFDYGIKTFGLTQAINYYNELNDQIKLITKNPYLYPKPFQYKQIDRFCVSGSDTIYYNINESEKTIEIIAIIGRQNYP